MCPKVIKNKQSEGTSERQKCQTTIITADTEVTRKQIDNKSINIQKDACGCTNILGVFQIAHMCDSDSK